MKSIQKFEWSDIRHRVHESNSKLAEFIDSLDQTHPFYLASYRYGDLIYSNGQLQLPDNENHPKELSYRAMPVALSLNKQLECFMPVNNRIVPLETKEPGQVLFSENSPWAISAGVRSIYSTAKISEKRRHNRLNRDFPVGVSAPKNLSDQWVVFKDIAKESDWRCEMLFFSKDWFEDANGYEVLKLKEFLRQQTWPESKFMHHQIIRDCLFSKLESQINIRYQPNILAMARHIMGMAAGIGAGLSFDLDETALPKKLIQQAYLESYGLEYAPILMGLSKTGNQYFSLAVPHCADFNEKLGKDSRLINLRELSHVLSKMQKSTAKDCQFLEQALKTKVQYFHQTEEVGSQIQATNQIPAQDLALEDELLKFPNHPLCVYGSVLNGLVGVAS